MVGEQVGNYQIESLLGQGGMGAVYRARHVMLGRPAAIKVLLPQYSANPEIVQRFFNEAKAATSIRHLGIVEVYDFGTLAGGTAYIAMELLRGESLALRMQITRLELETSLGIIRQMCGALGAAHALGIVHRDLKPDNVYLVPDPEVPSGERIKLLDFGIAKLTQEPEGMSHKTRTGALMGTPVYMAPEQCRGVPVDRRADIYSLGCILYELIARRPPFVGEGAGDILGAHIYQRHEPVDTYAAATPVSVVALVDRMLAKDPAKRFQTTGEVIAAIDALDVSGAASNDAMPHARADLAETLPGTTHPDRETPVSTTLSGSAIGTSVSPQRRPRRWMLAGLGSITVAGVTAIALWPHHSRSTGTVAADAAEHVTTMSVVDAAPDAAPVPVTVTIDSVPQAAHVFLDATDVGITPFHASYEPHQGRLAFRLSLAGYQDRAVDLPADQNSERTEQLVRVPARETTRHAVPHAAAAPAPSGGSAVSNDDDEAVNPLRGKLHPH